MTLNPQPDLNQFGACFSSVMPRLRVLHIDPCGDSARDQLAHGNADGPIRRQSPQIPQENSG